MVGTKFEIYFNTEEQLNTFLSMIAWMGWCGNVGHSTEFCVRLDGDGNARPIAIFSNPEIQEAYKELRKSITKVWDAGEIRPNKFGTELLFNIE